MRKLLFLATTFVYLAGSAAQASSCDGVGENRGRRAEIEISGNQIVVSAESTVTDGGQIQHVCVGNFRSNSTSPNYVVNQQKSLNCRNTVGIDLAPSRNGGFFVNLITSTFEGQVSSSYLCRQ